jgi:hypothetical protein
MIRLFTTTLKNWAWIKWCLFLVGCGTTLAAYSPGLSGGFLFDDYPNIVDNKGVQPSHASIPSLINAALSSPASDFKRPLASLSFAANYLAEGLDPYWMKLTNIAIHLLNGLLVLLLARALLWLSLKSQVNDALLPVEQRGIQLRIELMAILVAIGWMLLPINLTAVLYVVQRMESLANVFVMLGLLGYARGRCGMLGLPSSPNAPLPATPTRRARWENLVLCLLSITVPAGIGLLAKETAVMLPLYAFLVEWLIFRFKNSEGQRDLSVIVLFATVLILPMFGGLAWLLPQILSATSWATRDFTLNTRLLSESRVVVDYIVWTLLPNPQDLSFYHDNFHTSTSLLSPWTTAASILVLGGLTASIFFFRRRRPLVALGISLYLGCHLLTGTILPLELIYEHRNYFASFGLMLAAVPELAALHPGRTIWLSLPRRTLLLGLILLWGAETTMTAIAWGDPLLLSEVLAARAPDSPRAQYELGRTYIIYSHYDQRSIFTQKAYAPLERAAKIPGSSILPEQALIFMNARMNLPLKDDWWNSMITKLKARKPTVQDESSLGALTQCARDSACNLPKQKMTSAYLAALSHPSPSARLLAMYSDYAWNVLGDRDLGLRMMEAAVKTAPSEPAYYITLIRMLAAVGRTEEAQIELKQLAALNIGGHLDEDLVQLRHLFGAN